jgi:hypothetical protein
VLQGPAIAELALKASTVPKVTKVISLLAAILAFLLAERAIAKAWLGLHESATLLEIYRRNAIRARRHRTGVGSQALLIEGH